MSICHSTLSPAPNAANSTSTGLLTSATTPSRAPPAIPHAVSSLLMLARVLAAPASSKGSRACRLMPPALSPARARIRVRWSSRERDFYRLRDATSHRACYALRYLWLPATKSILVEESLQAHVLRHV